MLAVAANKERHMPISQKRELDDRFQESCHMGGIYLSFQAPM